jgi:sugar/nucleoside kinase (ribokinase family)
VIEDSANRATTPLAVGTGLIALDVVVSEGQPEAPSFWAGGTCCNVLTALSYLGWRTAPVARLRGGAPAARILSDLLQWGVRTDYISLDEDGSTPVIVQWIRQTPQGEPRHTFSWRCPKCGARLPGYKPVLVNDAESVGGRLDSPCVFFFDRLSRGALMLAQKSAELGAAVVFEPPSVGNPTLFREAWEIADIVKYSHERLQDLPAELEASTGPWLQIETLGRDGLRYRLRGRGTRPRRWQHLEAVPATRLRDTAGAGDWCTAGLIHKLFPRGARALETADDLDVRDALRYGQSLAAWTCGFEGPRGGMYEVAKSEFEQEIAALLDERSSGKTCGGSRRASAMNGVTWLCPSCEKPELGRKGVLHKERVSGDLGKR